MGVHKLFLCYAKPHYVELRQNPPPPYSVLISARHARCPTFIWVCASTIANTFSQFEYTLCHADNTPVESPGPLVILIHVCKERHEFTFTELYQSISRTGRTISSLVAM